MDQWKRWAADLSESHTTSPVLLAFRSPDAWSSWVIGLLAVLDAAAMQLALNPSSAPSQARLVAADGLHTVASDLRRSWLGLCPRSAARNPLVLTAAEFARAVELLHEVGFTAQWDAGAAWPQFHGWRVNYENLEYRWANRVLAPPAPSSGTRVGLRQRDVAPNQPPHRNPDPVTYRRPDFDA